MLNETFSVFFKHRGTKLIHWSLEFFVSRVEKWFPEKDMVFCFFPFCHCQRKSYFWRSWPPKRHLCTVFENYQNCRILIFLTLTFSANFCPIKSDMSGNTRIANVARFARNFECDFFFDFQTLCLWQKQHFFYSSSDMWHSLFSAHFCCSLMTISNRPKTLSKSHFYCF